MKRVILSTMMFLFGLSILYNTIAYAGPSCFRCSTGKLINIGDTYFEVVQACGEPEYIIHVGYKTTSTVGVTGRSKKTASLNKKKSAVNSKKKISRRAWEQSFTIQVFDCVFSAGEMGVTTYKRLRFTGGKLTYIDDKIIR